MSKRIRRRGGRKVASVPMAPMIDMVFLLLVFFMTASAMSQDGSKVELDLPEAPSSQVPEELSNRLVVSLDAAGAIFWAGTEIDEKELNERLEQAAENSPGMKLRIRADKATEFSAVKGVMRSAAKAGIESYLYATYQGAE